MLGAETLCDVHLERLGPYFLAVLIYACMRDL